MIYQRQKVLLALLKEAPSRSASKIQLVKWLFLLKEEESIDRHISFYSFFPYSYGPFSFEAYRDISELESFGWVESDSSSFRYTMSDKEYCQLKLPSSVIHSVKKVLENYGELSQKSLIDYVYRKYPWYASRSKIRKSDLPTGSPNARRAIYSLGYEGLSIDAFLDILLKVGIQVVIDSRSNPISRKYGFSKFILAGKCLDVGIGYHQFSDIGIPSEPRRKVRDRQNLWDFYVTEILSKNLNVLRSIADMCRSKPSVLICFEKNPEDCHRHIVARELSVITGLPIIHYIEGRWKKDGGENKGPHNRQDLPYAIE